MQKRINSHRPVHEHAVALVIVLAFVVLLTVAVIAFFSRATTERQVSNNSAKSGSADILALSAFNVIVGDLKQEIVDGSAPTASTPASYVPSVSANIIPQRAGTPAAGGIPIPNLIRISVHDDGPTGTNPMPAPGISSRASNANSTVISLNGRGVSRARWNTHYLIPRDPAMYGGANASNIGSDPVPSFTAPDWTLVTRQGPAAQTGVGSGATALSNSVSTNSNFVIGRYAFAIYDEGGLHDLNVAGYPTPAPAPAASPPPSYVFKGTPAFADLTPTTGINIPQNQINSLVAWRNYASVGLQASPNPANTPSGSVNLGYSFNLATANDYYSFIRARSDGFLKVNPRSFPSPATLSSRTDQAFVTRQDLLRYRRLTGISQDALEFLGTFSRELNSPTFSPATPTATNPAFTQIRVTSPFTRFDGTAATVGQSLVEARFPLNRLAWITYKGPSASLASTDPIIVQLLAGGVSPQVIQAGTAANIQACFGLSYVATDLWTYAHGAPSKILTLAEVATVGREPDFFELLQAGILVGSLGQDTAGGVTPSGSTVFPDVHMGNTSHHILSIAASIMDQADPDSIPTRIQFNPAGTMWTAYGVESLPYISQMYAIAGKSPDNTTDPNPWAIYLLFQLWNPHQNVATNTPTVRLRVDGGLGVYKGGNGEVWTNSGTDKFFNATGQTITLNNAFAPSAAPLQTTNTTGASASTTTGAFVPVPVPPASAAIPPGPLVGFRLPDYSYPTPAPTPAATPTIWLQVGASSGPGLPTKNRFNARLEVDTGSGNFVPYNHFIGIDDTTSWITDDPIQLRTANARSGTTRAFSAAQLTQTPPPVFVKSDPRSTRFGITQTSALPNPASTPTINEPLWPKATSLPNGYGGAIADPGGLIEHAPLRFAGGPYYPATLALNDGTAGRTTYTDNDGVARPGDFAYPEPSPTSTPAFSTAYYSSPTPAPSPTPPANTVLHFNDYKPLVLNRPFRSVAELGYACRDLPWKTLDFFTDKSGDAGLLDLFSISDEARMVAGHVSLNTRQIPVLQSILAGTLQAELDANDTLSKTGSSATAAPVISANIITASSATPFLNRSDLITRSGLPTSILPVPASGSTHDQRVKARREVVARALASVTQTRTWNLMIDVVAQSGRYPPTATSLDQFVVEGEKRYWLHVAIDRFTGEVIDQQLEAVYE
ncbi:MAG: hypothetical protein V7609_3464 [Verrucomicrobiota bacterium]